MEELDINHGPALYSSYGSCSRPRNRCCGRMNRTTNRRDTRAIGRQSFPSPRSAPLRTPQPVTRERLFHRAYRVPCPPEISLIETFTNHSIPGLYRRECRDSGVPDVGATETKLLKLWGSEPNCQGLDDFISLCAVPTHSG